MRARGLWLPLLAVGVLVVCVLAALAFPAARSEAQRVDDIAGSLRCPTCVAQSVADSASPISEAMRESVAARVRAGDTDDEVLAWFTDRYGAGALLDPPPSGLPLLLWILPLGLIAAAAIVVAGFAGTGARRWRLGSLLAGLAVLAVAVPLLVPRGSAPAASDAAPSSTGDAAPSSADILADAVAADPGDAVLRIRLAESYADAGRESAALEEWAAAYRLAPSSSHAAQEYAAALVKAGRTDEAIAILQREHARDPDEPGILLLLGTLLVQNDRPEGADLLALYLELAPDSPLRDEVREAIEGVER